MDKKYNGGSAFPLAFPDSIKDDQNVSRGMTLRDYLAAQAMQAILGAPLPQDADDLRGEKVGEYVARNSYAMADMMLAERAK